MWNVLGDYLTDSGWTVALSEAGIATSGIAESFLKVSHLTRTRHAHQITIAALYKLQKEAYSLSDVHYEQWRLDMIKKKSNISVLGYRHEYRKNYSYFHQGSLREIF